ncbi:helix-turn-helix domain-containing protein [Bizionia paragorgiae]|uniref:Transposase n=1 Tax=Bizionia paragorgiae TaxID=283786 RepID=A0A1H4DDZ4_BIZPA|nr:helix-turn-helix domain-containing protein [Bizionia paragorgiae]SEA70985.1 transposase [Bizionia paragorgiae]
MERKVKYNYDFKLRCVNEVLKKHKTVDAVSKLNGCHHTTLHDWIRFYEKYGKKGLLPRKNKVYSLPFKLKVIEAIDKDLLSFSQACLMFNISTKSVVMNWHRNYKKDGIRGLNHKTRGKPKSMQFKRAKKKSNKLLTREEELLLENESLRAELDLLKKLQALIQQEQNEKQ